MYILAADVGPTAYAGAIKVLTVPAHIQASAGILGEEVCFTASRPLEPYSLNRQPLIPHMC